MKNKHQDQHPDTPPQRRRRGSIVLRWTALLVAMVCTLWAFGALWHDFPWPQFRIASACAYAVAVLAVGIFVEPFRVKWLTGMVLFLAVLVWWLTLQPRQFRNWSEDVALLPHAAVDGERITLRNIRDFAYSGDGTVTPHYITRTYDLAKLQGVDLFLNYWGMRAIAHPILSFDFGDEGRVCFSIETRPEAGEHYSMLGALYRRYELTCVVATERDILRLRAVHRKGEDIYHYPLHVAHARDIFMDYIGLVNALRDRPQWYHAITSNCTTTIRQLNHAKLPLLDWRLLANGYGDKMLYDRGVIEPTMPFTELRKRARATERTRSVPVNEEFSKALRAANHQP